MELIGTMIGIAIVCGVLYALFGGFDKRGPENPLALIFGFILGIDVILLPLAILVKVIQYFWNY